MSLSPVFQETQSSIFRERINIKPYEYPELLQYKDAIRHSYWIHSEFNVTSDIQDFHTELTDEERAVISRTMLAISQIEVSVKRFWGDLYKYIPKPEIDDVGGTFAESEIRHKDAYSFLLEKLGLNEDFENIHNIPAIIDRVSYLKSVTASLREYDCIHDREKIVQALVIFSLFVEHISLFGQFFIITSFNKHKNKLKGMANIVAATSKEEEIHGKFGLELFRIIKREHPELISKKLLTDVVGLCRKAIEAEKKIIDWIFEYGDLSFVTKEIATTYIEDRFNNSLTELGIDPLFEVDQTILKETKWFQESLIATSENDFFNKRSIDYSKKTKTITEDDLF